MYCSINASIIHYRLINYDPWWPRMTDYGPGWHIRGQGGTRGPLVRGPEYGSSSFLLQLGPKTIPTSKYSGPRTIVPKIKSFGPPGVSRYFSETKSLELLQAPGLQELYINMCQLKCRLVLGVTVAANMDVFLENFQTTLTLPPPPSFFGNYIALFSRKSVKYA